MPMIFNVLAHLYFCPVTLMWPGRKRGCLFRLGLQLTAVQLSEAKRSGRKSLADKEVKVAGLTMVTRWGGFPLHSEAGSGKKSGHMIPSPTSIMSVFCDLFFLPSLECLSLWRRFLCSNPPSLPSHFLSLPSFSLLFSLGADERGGKNRTRGLAGNVVRLLGTPRAVFE